MHTFDFQDIKHIPNSIYVQKINLSCDNFALNWSVLEEGIEVEKGKIDDLTSIAAGKFIIFTISSKTSLKAGKKYFLNISMELKNKEPLLPANSEIAYEQFPLNVIKRSIRVLITTKTPTISEVGAKIMVTGADFTIIFDKEIGTISSFVK